MTTARQKILNYLAKARIASAREISRALQMSAPTVRHHLRVLVSDGRLEMTSTRGRDGRGRPEQVFSLPQASMGDNLSALADALLMEAGSGFAPEALAKRLAGKSEFTGQPIVKRLNLAIARLNQMKYHARWEAGAEGPRILFGHCPYAAILAGHPELCKMDEALLAELMGRPATQTSRIGEDGNLSCVFAVG